MAAAPDQLSCDLAGEAAILGVTSGSYYGLNGVGARIWTMIREPRAVLSVLEQLLAEYDVDTARCEHDLIALLQELADEGLVVVTDESA